MPAKLALPIVWLWQNVLPYTCNKYVTGELVVEGAIFVALLHEWIRCIFIVLIYTELTERGLICFYFSFFYFVWVPSWGTCTICRHIGRIMIAVLNLPTFLSEQCCYSDLAFGVQEFFAFIKISKHIPWHMNYLGGKTRYFWCKKNSNKQETNATVHLFVCNIFFKNSFIPQRLVYFDNCFKIIHSSVKREVTTQLKITFGTIQYQGSLLYKVKASYL